MDIWHLMKLILHLLLLLSISYTMLHAQKFEFPIVYVPALWTNDGSVFQEVKFEDGTMVRSILLTGTNGSGFSCGFYCNGLCDSFIFAIFTVQTNLSVGILPDPFFPLPQVVWSANRETPVTENATMQLTRDGDLILRDVFGNVVWSTNTSGNSVIGMNITETGNLLLFNNKNATIWQSFDHPTDSLLLGQKLVAGQRLVANVSATNSSRGQVFLSVTMDGLSAFIGYDPPQMYYKGLPDYGYLKHENGSIEFSIERTEKEPQTVNFLRLESDGSLQFYSFGASFSSWGEVFYSMGYCDYPSVCGNYGICSNGECICPQSSSDNNTIYFKPLDFRQPSLGCFEVTQLSCQALQYHDFLPLQDISYFNYIDSDAAILKGVDVESCKQACLKNCSCKATLFQYGRNLSYGSCFLPSQLFSLKNSRENKTVYNSSAFIKVQIPQTSQSHGPLNGSTEASSTRFGKERGQTAKILGSLGATFGAFVIICICVALLRKRKDAEEREDDCFEQVPGMPMRLSHEDLKVATANFNRKLGAGGFGSVFEGNLGDGTKVAVKRLDGVGQGKKEFLAEVQTIGSIHHVNLVRLIGFCAEKSYRLLVYEYMCNGSLDKWIFHRNQNHALDWKTRKKIILDIAKGLSYLHEDCRQRIAHLDIKPENILLDENFNAKVSDFGLSKLIDKELSHVMTTLRGTRGYLAPEWLSSLITEKVDVYSFGIVLLEIVCGRRNLDYSQPEDSNHLVNLLKEKSEDNQLFDMVDRQSEDMQSHVEEATEMLRIVAWCLQHDVSRRPSMSIIVKVLEGVAEIRPTLDYDFLTPALALPHNQWTIGISSPLLASVLSGPR